MWDLAAIMTYLVLTCRKTPINQSINPLCALRYVQLYVFSFVVSCRRASWHLQVIVIHKFHVIYILSNIIQCCSFTSDAVMKNIDPNWEKHRYVQSSSSTLL